jgi:hypothetical protein
MRRTKPQEWIDLGPMLHRSAVAWPQSSQPPAGGHGLAARFGLWLGRDLLVRGRLRPSLALLIHERTHAGRVAIWLTRVPELLASLAIAGAAALGTLRALIGRLRGAAHDACLACLGVGVAPALKSELKLLFGRAAPEA